MGGAGAGRGPARVAARRTAESENPFGKRRHVDAHCRAEEVDERRLVQLAAREMQSERLHDANGVLDERRVLAARVEHAAAHGLRDALDDHRDALRVRIGAARLARRADRLRLDAAGGVLAAAAAAGVGQQRLDELRLERVQHHQVPRAEHKREQPLARHRQSAQLPPEDLEARRLVREAQRLEHFGLTVGPEHSARQVQQIPLLVKVNSTITQSHMAYEYEIRVL